MIACPLGCTTSLDEAQVLDHLAKVHTVREVADAFIAVGDKYNQLLGVKWAKELADDERADTQMLRALDAGMTLRDWSWRRHLREDREMVRRLVQSGRVKRWCPRHEPHGRCTKHCRDQLRHGALPRSESR